jgi:FKBP-type peptidyl-prolyl cis-trans isomerase SlpA
LCEQLGVAGGAGFETGLADGGRIGHVVSLRISSMRTSDGTAPAARGDGAGSDSVSRVGPASHLTLHYRIGLLAPAAEVFSTFGHKPATLQLGIGQLAEPLERCLLGLAEGECHSFSLAAEQAFGARNPQLVQRLSRSVFDRHVSTGTEYQPGDLVELPAPGGGRYAGVIKTIDAESVLFDFNHPLAGQAIRFDVEILGVL